MSGISAMFFRDGRPVDPASLSAMLTRLASRGPDAAGVWHEGAAGLGHCARWTTPESVTERLPFEHDASVVTADARLDNRSDLITELGVDPRAKIGDGELILLAWECWGTDAPKHLLGDFAFVIWDARRQEIFCARDHMGVKPLYYHCASATAVVASEIKALLVHPFVQRRIDETRVADYLQPCFEDKAITMYNDIRRLPPAHWMLVGRGRVTVRRYWCPDPTRDLPERSDDQYADEFRALFTDAVRCRLRSGVRAGALLSGGLDSSSIACTAQRLDPAVPLPTFSAVFDDVAACDERRWIQPVFAAGNFEPHFVHADRVSPLVDLERMLDSQDEPPYAPNLFMHWALYRAAGEAGVGVLLDGVDGDTTVSHGLLRLAELLREGSWLTLGTEAWAVSRRLARPLPTLLYRSAVRPLLPFTHAPRPNGLIDPTFAERVGFEERLRGLGQTAPARTTRADHAHRLGAGAIPLALEVADKAAHVFDIEPRYPYFDRRLVEFCLALPARQKLDGGWTRAIVRRGLAGVLPDAVRWRGSKSDLSANFTRGLLRFERVRLDALAREPAIIAPYVNVPVFRDAWRRYSARPTNADALTVWRAATLALWLQRT